MEFAQEPKFKDVINYDFTFSNGYRIPIIIDEELGDKIEELEDRFILNLVEKPSFTDPDDKLAAEIATVYKKHLLTVVIQKRKQRVQTAEEQLEFRDTIKSLIKAPKRPQ